MTVKLKLLSIDAWRDEGGWYWNNQHLIEDGWFFEEDVLTPRRILNALRRGGFLTGNSKGRVKVDTHPEICDGYLFEICDKNTGESLLALSSIH